MAGPGRGSVAHAAQRFAALNGGVPAISGAVIRQTALRRWSATCAPSSALPKVAWASLVQSFSMAALCKAVAKAARAPGMTDTSGATAPKLHAAVDTLGYLIALTVTPADEQERVQVDALCQRVQEATGDTVVNLAWTDQGYTGEQASSDAAQNGVELQVVKLVEAKKGFVLLAKRWVVERRFS